MCWILIKTRKKLQEKCMLEMFEYYYTISNTFYLSTNVEYVKMWANNLGNFNFNQMKIVTKPKWIHQSAFATTVQVKI